MSEQLSLFHEDPGDILAAGSRMPQFAREAENRCSNLHDTFCELRMALDNGDVEDAYRIAGRAAALVDMVEWSMHKWRTEKEHGMSQPMRLMTSQTTVNWYTPTWVIDLAHRLLSFIDLDPASSERANATVRARRFYTKEDNGLVQSWASSTLWLNPPFDATGEWFKRLEAEYQDGKIGQALFLCNTAGGYTWYERMVTRWPAIQFSKRLAFIRDDGLVNKDRGGLAKKAQTIVYLGPDVATFEAVFGPHGRILHTTALETPERPPMLELLEVGYK